MNIFLKYFSWRLLEEVKTNSNWEHPVYTCILTPVSPSYLAALSLAGYDPPPSRGYQVSYKTLYFCLASEDLRDSLRSEAGDGAIHGGCEPDFYIFFIKRLEAEILTAKVWWKTVKSQRAPIFLFAQMVRRGSVWCGVAQYGAAWLSMVRHGSVGSMPACCNAGPSSILGLVEQGGFSHWAYKRWEMERDPGEWWRINVLYECNCVWSMYVCF